MRLNVVVAFGAVMGAVCSPAFASNVTYLGLRGSYAVTEDSSADAPGFFGDISFDDSYGGSISIGKFLGPDARIEAELWFNHSELDDFHVTNDTVNIVPLTGQTFPLSGEVEVIAPMVNAILELPIDAASIDLYLGAGVGGAHIDVNGTSAAAAGIDIDDDAWAFAYQLMAGATAPVADGIEALIGYRYFGTTDFSVDDPVYGDFEMNLNSHNVELGLLIRL